MTLMRPLPDALTWRGATYSTLPPRLALRRHLYLTLSRSEPGNYKTVHATSHNSKHFQALRSSRSRRTALVRRVAKLFTSKSYQYTVDRGCSVAVT